MNESIQPDQYGQTVLNPLGIIALLVLGFAMLLLPRRHAVLPMIILGCFVSQGQRFAVLTLNFDLGRAMLIFGTLRVLVHGEWNHFVLKNMDSVIVAFAAVGSLVYILQGLLSIDESYIKEAAPDDGGPASEEKQTDSYTSRVRRLEVILLVVKIQLS